ncbi:hypothetical protein LUZ60_015992 [Juncus effusus]|nr:hypothetical protein LUZ60_015992 [Juncus effusus]
MPAALSCSMDGHDPSDLPSSFLRRVSALFSSLSPSNSPLTLSLPWTSQLLDAFLLSLEEFRVLLHASAPLNRPPIDRLVADFFDRAVKSLDLCTAVRDGIERVRTWQKHVQIVVGSLAGPDPIGEGPARRARKAVGDLAIMMLDERDLPGSGSGTGHGYGFRNRSFALAQSVNHSRGHHRRTSSGGGGSGSSGNGHFRSLTWSVSRNWSATKQLQAIGTNLTAPRGVSISDLPSTIYTMGAILFVSMLSVTTSFPCQCDRSASLTGSHFSPPPRTFSWGPHVFSIYEKVLEEWKKREKKSNCGLLREIGETERILRELGEVLDVVQFPLEQDKEREIKELVGELEQVSEGVKQGLDPLERQVREVFNRIVKTRTEILESLNKGLD